MTNTPMTPNASTPATQQRPWLTGVILICLGVLLLAGQYIEQNDWLILGGISALLFAVYAATRKPGWIIPAFILAGLAVGLGFEDYGYSTDGSSVLLGLGGGFIAIYVFSALTRAAAHWWPLIPGGILATIGGSMAIGGTQLAESIGRFWPLALVIAGVVVLIGGRRQLTGSHT